MAILTIEGNSFCGKTTTAQELAKQTGFPFVPEYYFYLDKNEEFPNFPPPSNTSALDQVEFFLKLEIKRSSYARDLAKKHELVIMDRSFWTVLALRFTGNHLKWTRFDLGYTYAVDRVTDLTKKGLIICPDLLCLMNPPDDVFLKRVKSRGNVGIAVLNELKTKQIMHNNFFTPLIKKMGKDGLILNPIENDVPKTVNILQSWISTRLKWYSRVSKKSYLKV